MKEELIQRAYELAKERYAAIGVDVEKAMDALQKISLSLHCWQADDVAWIPPVSAGCADRRYPGYRKLSRQSSQYGRIETRRLEGSQLYSWNSSFESA